MTHKPALKPTGEPSPSSGFGAEEQGPRSLNVAQKAPQIRPKTRIVLYSTYFLPEVGGVQAIAETLATRLSGRSMGDGSIQLTVITQKKADSFQDGTLPFRLLRRPAFGQLLGAFRQADIIHLAGPAIVPLVLGLILRKPVVIEHHGFQTICPNGQLFYEPTQTPCPGHFMAGRHRECLRCNRAAGDLASWRLWLLAFARRWLAGKVAANIAPTHALDALLRLPRTTTIHHGVSDSTLPTADPSLNLPLTFAFVGRLVTTKGAHVLLEAARQLKAEGFAFRVKIVGEGPERTRLQREVEELNLKDRVSFYGYLPMARLNEVLSDAVAIVVPSLAGEVFGLVVVEAMLRGCLPIVSDTPAFSEVVGRTALKFRPGDSDGLAACLRQVLAAPESASEMGRQARARGLELFREKRMVDEHLKLYWELLGDLWQPR